MEYRPGILYVGNKSVQLQNVHIQAKTNGKGIINGFGNNNSIYNYLTIEDT